MKLFFVIFAVLTLSLSSSYAETKSQEKVVFVKGMVCAFCAQGIEKRFSKEPEIDKILVELEKHRVTLNFKEGQSMDDQKIASILEAAGYTVDESRTE